MALLLEILQKSERLMPLTGVFNVFVKIRKQAEHPQQTLGMKDFTNDPSKKK